MTGPDRRPVVNRRCALAVLAAAVIGPAALACSTEPPAPDPLEAELESARADSELAAAAAAAAPREIAPALSVVADERARHATALVEELARAAGKPTPTETPAAAPETKDSEATDSETTDSETTATAATAAPAPPPTLADVIAALRRSAESAARLAPTLSGYRAGLMGSIAAACTTSYTVGLPPVRRPA